MKFIFLFFSFFFIRSSLIANPQGPLVVQGKASFHTSEFNSLQIVTGERTIIEWRAFSIAPGEVVRFSMPDVDSAVLNRVVSGNPSCLYGDLYSNGKVYLVNPNGVIIGHEGVVSTGSFVASTFDVLNEQFMRGSNLLFKGDSKAAIVNYGVIGAWDGDVSLIGFVIDNQGQIYAPSGEIGMGVGTELLLKPEGSQRIYIRPAVYDAQREGLLIDNSGILAALQVELKADGNPYAHAIRLGGIVDAFSVIQQGGRIFLYTPEDESFDLPVDLLTNKHN